MLFIRFTCSTLLFYTFLFQHQCTNCKHNLNLQDAEYEVTEPLPNNITQASGNLMIIETEGACFIFCVSLSFLCLCGGNLSSPMWYIDVRNKSMWCLSLDSSLPC